MTTYGQFWDLALADMSLGGGNARLDALSSITATEGGNGYWNPANIEWHSGENTNWRGYKDSNSVGVQMYENPGVGALASSWFFLSNGHWRGVVNALIGGNYATIINALAAAYTWANFTRLSQSHAHAITARTMPGKQIKTTTDAPTGTASHPNAGIDYAGGAWSTLQDFSGNWANGLAGNIHAVGRAV